MSSLKALAAEVSKVWSPPERRALSLADVRIAKLLKAIEAMPNDARLSAFEEAARTAEGFIHNSVPDDESPADDAITRTGRYSNGTVRRIAAAIRGLK